MFTKRGVETVLVSAIVLVGGTINTVRAAGLPDYSADSPVPVASQQPEPEVRWLAIGLMFVMIATLIYTGRAVVRSFHGVVKVPAPSWEKYVTPMLAIVGMAVASSLTSVQAQVVEANTDPWDGCFAVLNSSYAKLFDTFPVSVMGRQAYSIVFWTGLLALPRSGKSMWKIYRGILVVTTAGTLFSLYLTFLEVFVIRAICGRCLLSAILMTLLMIISLVPAMQGIPRSRTRYRFRAQKVKMWLARNARSSNDR